MAAVEDFDVNVAWYAHSMNPLVTRNEKMSG